MKERRLIVDILENGQPEISDKLKEALDSYGYVVNQRNEGGRIVLEETKASQLKFRKIRVGGKVVAQVCSLKS